MLSSRPRNEDRIEMMSIQEPIFRKADDSVLSIIPSRLSSRLSSRRFFFENDTASFMSKTSVKSRLSVELRYIPFSFDNDLFTSYVYKRNYRLPSMNSRSQSIPRSSVQAQAPPESRLYTPFHYYLLVLIVTKPLKRLNNQKTPFALLTNRNGFCDF